MKNIDRMIELLTDGADVNPDELRMAIEDLPGDSPMERTALYHQIRLTVDSVEDILDFSDVVDFARTFFACESQLPGEAAIIDLVSRVFEWSAIDLTPPEKHTLYSEVESTWRVAEETRKRYEAISENIDPIVADLEMQKTIAAASDTRRGKQTAIESLRSLETTKGSFDLETIRENVILAAEVSALSAKRFWERRLMAYEAMISPENKIQIETDLLNHEIMRYRFRFGSQMILGRDECQAFCLNLFNPTEKQIKELGYESMEAFKACSEIGENRLARLLSCANASELG